VLLWPQHIWCCGEHLWKCNIWSVSFGWSLRTCISHVFPIGTDAAIPETTLRGRARMGCTVCKSQSRCKIWVFHPKKDCEFWDSSSRVFISAHWWCHLQNQFPTESQGANRTEFRDLRWFV
jgi:hypothetical protein